MRKAISFLATGVALLLLPLLAKAQPQQNAGDGPPIGNNPGSQLIGDNPDGGQSTSLLNPLRQDNLLCFLQDVLDVVVIFAVPIIILMVIYAGFLYVTAQGAPEKLKKAHFALLYAVIGGVIILGANLLIDVIVGTVNQLGANASRGSCRP